MCCSEKDTAAAASQIHISVDALWCESTLWRYNSIQKQKLWIDNMNKWQTITKTKDTTKYTSNFTREKKDTMMICFCQNTNIIYCKPFEKQLSNKCKILFHVYFGFSFSICFLASFNWNNAKNIRFDFSFFEKWMCIIQ